MFFVSMPFWTATKYDLDIEIVFVLKLIFDCVNATISPSRAPVSNAIKILKSEGVSMISYR